MQTMNSNICVAILIGGLSSRMGGGIKSLEKFNNKTIFDRILKRIHLKLNTSLLMQMRSIINLINTICLLLRISLQVI